MRRWSQSLNKGAKSRKSFRQRTIHFMPSRMLKREYHYQKLDHLRFNNIMICLKLYGSPVDRRPTPGHNYGRIGNRIFGEGNRATRPLDGGQCVWPATSNVRLPLPMTKTNIFNNNRIQFLHLYCYRDILRALPQSMSVKREIKSKVNRTIIEKTKEEGETKWSKLKYLSGVWYISTRVFSRHILTDYELWYRPMKEIEGHFGGGVGTYFKFLRYLFILNMILMILSMGYVIIDDSSIIYQISITRILIAEFISFQIYCGAAIFL